MKFKSSERILDGILTAMAGRDMEYYLITMELEDKIRELLECVAEAKYVGKVYLKRDDDFWLLKLGPNEYQPFLSLAYEGDEDSFMKFLDKEFRMRKQSFVSQSKAVLHNGYSFLHQPMIEL